MMTARAKRIIMRLALSVAALVVVCLVTAVFVINTQWFSDVLRAKVIAAIEDSTGGTVELQSFRFEPLHLTVVMTGLVLHGTEPRDESPLAAIDSLAVRVKLFPHWGKTFDIPYLIVEKPRVNLVVNADGTTNIPTPKVKKPPSSTSPLATVVDLEIGRFRIDQGNISYLRKQAPFSLEGKNLRFVLNYDLAHKNYSGRIQIAPLTAQSAANKPVALRIDLPLTLERDAVRVSNGRITSQGSDVALDASLVNLKAPTIAANVRAKVSVIELQQALALPINANAKAIPDFVTANLDGQYEESTGVVALRNLDVRLGQTYMHAAGTTGPANGQGIRFNSDFALAQLSKLFNVGTAKIAGELLVSGQAGMNADHQYMVDGNISSRALGVDQGEVHLTNVSLTAPFHVTPDVISVDRLQLAGLGGTLSAKVSLTQMRALSVEGNLRGFSLRAIATALSGHPVDYAAEIGGIVRAADDLKAPGSSNLVASARLAITPSGRGVPVNGRIEADYAAKHGDLNVGNSFVAFPQSRVTFSGTLNQKLEVHLTSHNLNDFLPAARWNSGQAAGPLPVTLKGGSADLNAQIEGSLSAPKIEAQASITKFVAKDSLFDKLSLELTASKSGAAVQNGLLLQKNLRSTFDASIGLLKWHPVSRSPISANVVLQNAGLGDLLALGGEGNIPAGGNVSANVHINGTYGDPLGTASIQIPSGEIYGQPFSDAAAGVKLSPGLVSLDQLQMSSAGGTLNANGMFRHPADSMTAGHLEFHLRSNGVQLAAVKPLQEKSPGAAGAITLTADAAADLAQSAFKIAGLEANISAANLRVRNQDAGNLTAVAHTSSGMVVYSVKSNFSGSAIDVEGRTGLASGYATQATATIRSLSLKNALDIAGQGDVPVTGTLSADASVNGKLDTPNVTGSFDLSNGNIYEEPVNHLSAKLSHNNTVTEISALSLDVPAGHISLSGRYDHPHSLDSGRIEVRVNGGDLQIGKLEHVQLEKPGLAGLLHLTAEATANVTENHGSSSVVLSSATADVTASNVAIDKHALGGMTFSAQTSNRTLNFKFDSDLAQSKIHAAGQTQLAAGYQTKANLDFANVHYVNVAPLLYVDESIAPSFDALVEGKASVDGALEDPASLSARLELTHFDLHSAARGGVSVASVRPLEHLQNDGPVIISLDKSVLKVQQFHLKGPKTDVQLSGGMDFNTTKNPLQLKVLANANLGTLQDVDEKFYSSGDVSVIATVEGTFAQPALNGKIELKNASVNYADIPNGLSNANGVILLSGTTASVRNLTAESGGGKISLSGFVGLSPRAVIYNLRANAQKVRTRYDNLSVTSNANITLTGSSRRSLISGNVSIQRVAYSSSSDIGSLLYSASSPPAVASTPSPSLANMRLDVNIVTASDVRIVTSYVQKLDLSSNLTLRGTAAEPGMVGHITVTDGQLAFFGNTYNVNRGSVNFYDPLTIKPELDFSLETIAQGVDVTLGVTGPLSDMKLSYRSDPPLTFEQIAQLLATNTTPFDPTIASHQPPAAQQSASQMGESALLSQAVASPLSSRLQRVFGLTQFKIDPSVAGSNGQPTAKVTLQQKIANNITFTYITDVTQSNSEIVRVQWDFGARTSAVALRDYNGNVSVELFYKFQKR